MKKILSALILSQSVFASPAPVPYKWGVYKPSELGGKKVIIVDWFSAEGRTRLGRSKYTHDFFQMAHVYQPQINPVYATVASAVVALNAMRLPKHTIPSQEALELEKPKALGGGRIPFPAYSQTTFLNEQTDKIKDRKTILMQNATPENENDKKAFRPGLGLTDLKSMLETVYHSKAVVTFADAPAAAGAKKFREDLKQALTDANSIILSNFKGDMLGASTEGTVSPLAAYDEKTDSVLILDVTGHKNPWYWVPLTALYESMHTQYDGTYRGYIRVFE